MTTRSLLPTRRVGRTAIEVTELGFGGAPLGGFRTAVPDAEAAALVAGGYDAGINFFDTSPYYGYGRSELRFGAALREKPRDSYVLSTKIGRVLHAMKPDEKPPAEFRPNGLPGFAPTFDYSYDGVMRSLEHSHLRLGISRIDVVLIHDVDFWTTQDRPLLEQRFRQVMESGYRALSDLRSTGVIGAIGVGLNEADTSLRFLRAGDFDCVLLAGRYTLLEQGALGEFMPECVKRNVSVILGGPFNSGVLAGGTTYNYVDAPPDVIDRARRIAAVCQRHNVPMPAAALQFPLAHQAVCSVIPGALSASEVAQNVEHMRRAIPVDLWAELVREGLLDPAAPVPTQ